MGKERKVGSRAAFTVDYSARTKLKFRQPGQTSTDEIARRDLKAELLRAEREALDKKRKAAGLAPLPDEMEHKEPIKAIQNGTAADDNEEEQARKRRKILEEAAELDKDDSSDEEDGNEANGKSKGKGKEKATDDAADDDDDENDDDDESVLCAISLVVS
jgi:protein CWC15